MPCWVPKWVSKAFQNVTKSLKSQRKHEKDDCLKMSTSRQLNTQNQGSRVPEKLQSRPKTVPRLCQNPAEFLIDVCIDFLSIFERFWDASWPPFAPKNFQKGAALTSPSGPRFCSETFPPQDPSKGAKWYQHGPHMDQKWSQNGTKMVPDWASARHILVH